MLGRTDEDEQGSNLRSTLKRPMKRLSVGRKSYLTNTSRAQETKRAQSVQRKDAVKSALFSALEQDDTSTTFTGSDDDTGSPVPLFGRRRSQSLDLSVPKKKKSMKRGKKSDVLAEKNGSGNPERTQNGRRPRPTASKNSEVRRSLSYDGPPRSQGKGRARSNSMGLGTEPSAQKTVRRGSMLVLGGYPNRRDSKEPEPKAPARRSMSLGYPRKRAECVRDLQSKDHSTVVSRRKSNGALGAFLSNNSRQDDSDQEDYDDDSSDEGRSVTSAASWISWAASAATSVAGTVAGSAMKPLEKLYDDVNGIESKAAKQSRKTEDPDEDSDDDEKKYTKADHHSNKLTTREKISGLRFVASKQRRQSLYM